ncbi:hypothetical protein PIB30_075783 [Stylosanthes scabra]|uniref:Uncharacterized protein n=1 Tax=Stylosanthes scabra TaxID=79078 RepID=A0ABU6YQS6_9FABA|nr:hypothetical protein [Stylosanthes scabra]
MKKDLSISNVVKSEKGVVVNQPTEKRRPISVKRRRAEEGTSEKGKVIDLTNSKCCGKEVSLDEVKVFTSNQRKLHGYVGDKDLSSIWSEQFPLPVVLEEHFQSKVDFDLIESVARMLSIGRYEELKAKREAEQKRDESLESQKSMALQEMRPLPAELPADFCMILAIFKVTGGFTGEFFPLVKMAPVNSYRRIFEFCR